MKSSCLPIKREYLRGKVGGKGSLLYFGGGQPGLGGGGQTCVQRTTLLTDNQGARAFIGEGRGLDAETARSALTVILKLVMRWSDQCHLGCFRYS